MEHIKFDDDPIAMKPMRFRGPKEMKDLIYEIVRKTKYDSFSHFVRIAIENQLSREWR